MEATAIIPVRSSTCLLAVARMIHFLVVISLSISLPTQSTYSSLNGDDTSVDPLDGNLGNRLGQVLSVVDGGG